MMSVVAPGESRVWGRDCLLVDMVSFSFPSTLGLTLVNDTSGEVGALVLVSGMACTLVLVSCVCTLGCALVCVWVFVF